LREIIRQVCAEMGVAIINGASSRDHVHMFVEIPPQVSVSDFVRRAKGRSSRKIQQEFEHIRKRYRGNASGGGDNFYSRLWRSYSRAIENGRRKCWANLLAAIDQVSGILNIVRAGRQYKK